MKKIKKAKKRKTMTIATMPGLLVMTKMEQEGDEEKKRKEEDHRHP